MSNLLKWQILSLRNIRSKLSFPLQTGIQLRASSALTMVGQISVRGNIPNHLRQKTPKIYPKMHVGGGRMEGGLLRVSGSMIKWGYGVRGWNLGRLGLMEMPPKTIFLSRLLAYKAIFLIGNTPKTQQKCMANDVLWEEE